MTIQSAQNAGELSIILGGRLDTTTAPQLEAEISSHSGVNSIVMDFASLDYISSAGLRVLLGAQKAMNACGGSMVIKNVNDTVREVFDITGFIDILTLA